MTRVNPNRLQWRRLGSLCRCVVNEKYSKWRNPNRLIKKKENKGLFPNNPQPQQPQRIILTQNNIKKLTKWQLKVIAEIKGIEFRKNEKKHELAEKLLGLELTNIPPPKPHYSKEHKRNLEKALEEAKEGNRCS